MTTRKSIAIKPVYWSILIFIIAQTITILAVVRENPFLDEQQIYLPSQPPEIVTIWPTTTTLPSGEVVQPSAYSSLGPILIYFFAVVIALGIILFLVPLSVLKIILRAVFAILFCWGTFIILVLWLPWPAAIAIGLIIGAVWFIAPVVWLHNIALMLALCAVGAVFGRFIAPWTVMILLGVIAVYDIIAVRFGYMMWMVKKLSESTTLPVFFIPRFISEWLASLKQTNVAKIADEKPAEREYSILGGGDIAFPLLLIASVYFAHGLPQTIVMGIAALIGLIAVYVIQAVVYKGKPVAGTPPVAVSTLIGLLIIQFWIPS